LDALGCLKSVQLTKQLSTRSLNFTEILLFLAGRASILIIVFWRTANLSGRVEANSGSIPPLDEQEQIAAFLDWKTGQIDALLQKQALIEKLKESGWW
jgi:hypothetical protein